MTSPGRSVARMDGVDIIRNLGEQRPPTVEKLNVHVSPGQKRISTVLADDARHIKVGIILHRAHIGDRGAMGVYRLDGERCCFALALKSGASRKEDGGHKAGEKDLGFAKSIHGVLKVGTLPDETNSGFRLSGHKARIHASGARWELFKGAMRPWISGQLRWMVDPLNGRIERKRIGSQIEAADRVTRKEGLALHNCRAVTMVAKMAVLRHVAGSGVVRSVGMIVVVGVSGLVKELQMVDLVKRLCRNQQRKRCEPQNPEALGRDHSRDQVIQSYEAVNGRGSPRPAQALLRLALILCATTR